MTKLKTKNPIKNLPARQPGQSSREKADKIFEDGFLPYLLAVAFTFIIAMLEWFKAYSKAPPQPKTFTAIFVLVLLFAVRKAFKTVKAFRQVKLGELGEQAVGQMLDEKLRPMGCQVFHDILADTFNVDHFVVGPMGLFCIETKTHRKPAKGDSRVILNGDSVTINGFTPDRDPIVQAKAEARWMSDLIEQSTGKRFPVQPILVYPGWYVETTRPNANVWVLNETVTPTFIKNSRSIVAPEDVSLITFHLKRYVISKDK